MTTIKSSLEGKLSVFSSEVANSIRSEYSTIGISDSGWKKSLRETGSLEMIFHRFLDAIRKLRNYHGVTLPSHERAEVVRYAKSLTAEAFMFFDTCNDSKTSFEEGKAEYTAQHQIDRLALFIMKEVPGEPSESEGAVDTAIRIIRTYQDAIEKQISEVTFPKIGSEGGIITGPDGMDKAQLDKLGKALSGQMVAEEQWVVGTITADKIVANTIDLGSAMREELANEVAKWLFNNTTLSTAECIQAGFVIRGRDPKEYEAPHEPVNDYSQPQANRSPAEVAELCASFIEPKQTAEDAMKQGTGQGWNALKWAADAIRKAFK